MRKQAHMWGARAAALLILLSLLAGCGGLGLATPEPVELNFAYIDTVADYQPLADAFHKAHPHITIHLSPSNPRGNPAREMINKAAEADVIRVPVMNVGTELAAAFLPLDTLLSTSQDFPQEDLLPGTLEGLRESGKQVGLPAGTNPFVVYYLPKKFSAAGVQPPASWTLDDFVAIAEALNNPSDAVIGTDSFAYGYCTYPTYPDVALFTYLFGGRLFDSLVQVSRPTLNDPGNVETLAWYRVLKEDRGLIYRRGCGMWVDWLDKSTFGAEGAPEAEPLPLPRHAASVNIATQDGYFILSRTEHPDEAFLWARFLMEQQSASGRLIPPLRSAVESREYGARAPQSIVTVARSLPEQTVVLSMEMMRNERFGQMLALFGQAAGKVIEDGEDPRFTLDEAQQQAEALFNQ